MSKTTVPSSLPTPFTIVGIGASAGGLAALKQFFKQVPQDCGLAFVVVVHLAPDHESHLADLLQPHVHMPVRQVQETTSVEVNHVYVIPPGSNLSAIDTHLRLTKLSDNYRRRAPIDHFFRTLAATHDGHSIGIILTGTGSDGTLGLKEIKEKGGITIVQEPNEAEYDGMPQSAIATGLVDLVLPLAEIPQAIINYAATEPRLRLPRAEKDLKEPDRQLLQKVFVQIRSRTGRDFSRYKRATILRRIARRMQLRQVVELAAYVELLRKDPEEVRALADDMLITVTSFFRDPERFERIERDIIPNLLAGKGPEDTIRVWSVGCATGEEAYSLGIILLEATEQLESPPLLQIFASDLHEHSLHRAREGFYPGDIKADISLERLKRFFHKESNGYRIRKEVRELVVFTPHNLLSDPPFSRLDLLSCRNVLIYLQRDVQSEVIDLFHYALRPDGYLLLGISESIENSELFVVEDKKYCIFRKRHPPNFSPRLPSFPFTPLRMTGESERAKLEKEPLAYGSLHRQLVLHYAPPNLMVSPDDKVVQLSERVGRYLVLPGGEATLNVYKVIRKELRLELRAALYSVRESGEEIHTNTVVVDFDGGAAQVAMEVLPAPDPEYNGFCLISFRESPVSEGAWQEGARTAVDHNDVLATELDRVKQQLQSVIEEYETSREEMKASYEEMQSTNEELRSTMEELETSKEELQSMNEELTTVNQENRHKVAELAQLSSDLHNLLSATDIATLFLDRELRILRFTPKLNELFNVRMSDRGRPLTDITHRLGYDELPKDARRVLASLVPIEREVTDHEDRVFLTRLLPYRSTDDRIEGIVITFVDITQRVETAAALRASELRYRSLFESIDEGFCIIEVLFENDRAVDYRFLEVNPAFQQQTGLENVAGKRIRELSPDLAPDLEAHWFEAFGRIARSGMSERFMYEARSIGNRWFDVLAFPVERPEEHKVAVLFRDITEHRQMEQRLRLAKEAAEEAAQAKADFLAYMSHEIRTPLNTILGFAELMLLLPPEELQESLETLKVSASDLKTLVNDILDFSKIQTGKVKIEEAPVKLASLLDNICRAHRLLTEEHGNELNLHLAEEVPPVVFTDQLKLQQVLRNLISNALKFTRNGRVDVTVSLAERTADRLWLTFSVADTGIGIPAEKLDAIFEAFTQADVSTERLYGGTGLGLSISKLLLELLDSRIQVITEVGKGSRFFFDLPVREAPAAELPPEITVPNVKVERLLKQASILLVEDTHINRRLLGKFLHKWWQLQPVEVENGEQALAAARKHRYDLILMDLHMPIMDGYEATRLIRQLPGYANVPIMALTADTAPEVKKQADAGLFDAVVTKPFNMEELRRKIIELTVDRQRRNDSDPAAE